MLSDFITVSVGIASIVIATTAVVVAIFQTRLTRKSIQGQAYLGLEALEKASGYREGMRIINKMPDHMTYEQFLESFGSDEQQRVYDAVAFLNFIAHLVAEDFLTTSQAWRTYVDAYRTSWAKLSPWWIDGTREESNARVLISFERMASVMAAYSKAEYEELSRKTEKAAYRTFRQMR